MHTIVSSPPMSVFYCCFTRHKYDNFRYSRPAHTIEEAEREAASLQSSGYHGTIIQTYDPIYDDESSTFHNFVVIDHF